MKFGLFCLMPQRDIRKSAGQIAAEAIEQAQDCRKRWDSRPYGSPSITSRTTA